MAKSLRASKKKANKTSLRAKVHQPVEDARIERLSAKLLELANKPKETVKDADTDMIEDGTAGRIDGEVSLVNDTTPAEKMDVDETTVKKTESRPRSNSSKVQKKRRAKVVFAVGKKHGTRASGKGYKGPGIR